MTLASELSIYNICWRYFRANKAQVVRLLAISLWYPIATLTVTPAIIGKFTRAFTEGSSRWMLGFLIILVVLNVMTVAVNNFEQLQSELFGCDIAEFTKRLLLDAFFRTHVVGSASALDCNISLNIRIFSTAVTYVIDLYRVSLLPHFISLFAQGAYLAVLVDPFIGAIALGIAVCAVSAIYRASVREFPTANLAVEANSKIYSEIDEIVAMFDTIVATDGALENELRQISLAAAEKRYYRRGTILGAILNALPETTAIVLLSVAYGYRVYKRYVIPVRNGESLSGAEIERVTTSVTMFFAILASVRDLLLMTYTVSDTTAKVRVSRDMFVNSATSEACGGGGGGGGSGGCTTAASVVPEPETHDGDGCGGGDGSLHIASTSVTAAPPNNTTGDANHHDATIVFDRISFRYSPNKPWVLRDVSFSIPLGSRMAVVGKNGSGKSTIMRLLMRFAIPASGDIRVGGVSILNAPPEEIRRRLVYAVQTPVLFNRTILENIIYPEDATPALHDAVERFIQDNGVSEYIRRIPGGLDAVAGRRGERLSGGQRQIVQLMRVLFRSRGEILLLDEITSALDVTTQELITSIICAIPRTKTVLLITHDPTIQNVCDGVIRIGHGMNEIILTKT